MTPSRRLVAVALLVALSTTACDAGDSTPDAADPTGSASTSPSGETSAEAEAVTAATAPAEPEEPIMIGSSRYVSPCGLLPPGDMLSLYPRIAAGAEIDQSVLESSPTQQALRRDRGVVVTRCRLHLSDPGDHALEVEVDQFAEAAKARAAFADIRRLGTGAESAQLRAEQERLGDSGLGWLSELAAENERDLGGHPVAGAPGLLYVPGHHDYVVQVRNLLVRMRYDTVIQTFEDRPLTPAQYAQQTPRMVKAARLVRRNAARGSESQAPLPTVIGPEDAAGPTTYVEPCALLDVATATEIMGHAPTEPTEVSSLDADTRSIREAAPAKRPYAGTSSNSCVRAAHFDQRGNFVQPEVSLEVRYLADPARAEEAMEDWTLMAAFLGDPGRYDLGDLERAGYVMRHPDTAADVSWTTDSKYTDPDSEYRFTSSYFASGGYLLRLKASSARQGRTQPVEPSDYAPLIEAIVERLPATAS